MDEHIYPYWTLFKSKIPDLNDPDIDGWAIWSVGMFPATIFR